MRSPTEAKAPRRFSTRRLTLLAVVFAVVLASVTAGMIIWRDGRIDYRTDAPVFGSKQGDYDCDSGLSAIMDEIGVQAPVQERPNTCSVTFENPSAPVGDAWKYTIRVRHDRFDADFGHYRSLEDSRGADECALFPYGFTGVSRYIDGQGGFCVLRSSDPDYRKSKEVASKVLLVRFGEQIEVDIAIQLPRNAELTSPERTMPFSRRNYLEYQAAKTFTAQLDPTGMAEKQLSQYTPFPASALDRSGTGLNDWCSTLSMVDVEGIANTDIASFLEYEVELVDGDADWWEPANSDEIHCSAAWAIKARNESEPGSSEAELLGQAAGLNVTPWPWGTEVPEGGSGIENGRTNCTSIVSGTSDSALTDELETFDGITSMRRCDAEGEQTEIVFLIETAFVVRIWAFGWDSEGYPRDGFGWNEPVQDEILAALLDHLAQQS